ncbi:uncharacterized protein ALTATR162_LOCUS4524 [Alternaria atra]|uniref:Uncharacterized protein n=1 Tax=Alternaria atra TaxID=119953 RepID=A0A8J2MZ88_9PLEO|nr:uncharacterized protein ALTATR162_LOCUS4524 [Alternaria atra]CAG5156728.1 unnamed protein product [Alternaria atra]
MDRNRTVSGGHSDNAPLMSSAEPPGYDGGDVSMQHVDDTSYSPQMVLSPEIMDSKGGVYTTLNTPSSTFDVEDGTHHHKNHKQIKRFDHHEARKTLLKTGAMKLLVTLFFSAAICVTLKSWEGFRDRIVLSNLDVRIFNSLTIGLSLCLGLNILASLKHYASVFRWSFLTRRYVSLEVFDLILHLSSLAKVTKLMIISSPGFRGKTWLRKFSWFKDVRDDGTKWMWLACLAWLSLNIGSQILVALLSLFWPMENSEIPLFSKGNVTVADMNTWYIGATPPDISDDYSSESELEAAWMYGTEAMTYPNFTFTTPEAMVTDLSGLPGTPIYKGDNAWHYRFFNREPTHPWINYAASSRNITVRATCEQLDLKDGKVYDVGDDPLYIMAKKQGETEFVRYNVTEQASGSVTWMASVYENCGTRCTNFTVMQLPDSRRVNNTSLFLCNNTLEEVVSGHAKNDIVLRDRKDTDAVWGSSDFARIAAGAIGWTGIPWNGWEDRQTRSYSQGSKLSPAHEIAKEEVEELLMRFTIGAVAAFDDHGIRYNVTGQTVVPSQGQQLNVDWSYIFSILGGICFIQFLALCLLGIFANRTIVRDESFFSMAMLLNPVVSRINGESAMVMSGDEIKDARALRFKKIKYDYHEGGKGEPNRVAIFFEGEDRRESRKSWAAGSYS